TAAFLASAAALHAEPLNNCAQSSDPFLAIEGCSQLTEAAGINDEQLALAFNNRANAYGAIGQRDRAIADYSRAIALDPNYANAYHNRGTTYLEIERYDLALTDFDHAIQLAPDMVPALT